MSHAKPWLLATLLAFSSSTDNFAVGLSVALAGSPLPLRVNLIIAACNATGAMCSATFGALLGQHAPSLARCLAPLAAASIFGYLTYEELRSYREGEDASPLARSAAEGVAWKLAVPMTLNNLAGGVASGVVGVSGAFAGACAFAASVAMMAGGHALGERLGAAVHAHLEPRLLAAAVFGAMALLQTYDALTSWPTRHAI